MVKYILGFKRNKSIDHAFIFLTVAQIDALLRDSVLIYLTQMKSIPGCCVMFSNLNFTIDFLYIM